VRLRDGEESFVCERCGTRGRVVREELECEDPGDVVDEVHVVYGYDPAQALYTFVEIAREPGLLGHRSLLTLRTPLIEHPEVARVLAQILLARSNARLRGGTAPRRESRAELVAQGWKVLS
jgi:hypothetical protein